jgi:tRNA (mo5U34)-methyltransferase
MLDAEAIRTKIASFSRWYHQIELAPGVTTPGVNASSVVLERLNLPEDCRGLRALDIGARDGYFSFELERRGAEVLAIDYARPTETGFAIAQEILNSKVVYQVANVYDLNAQDYGQFDIVLFLGVLYHLRNPLLALDHIWSVCRNQLWVESHVLDKAFMRDEKEPLVPLSQVSADLIATPIMQFYPGAVLNNDATNWWVPNMACLRAMLKESNFVIGHESLAGNRGLFICKVNDDPHVNYYRQLERTRETIK